MCVCVYLNHDNLLGKINRKCLKLKNHCTNGVERCKGAPPTGKRASEVAASGEQEFGGSLGWGWGRHRYTVFHNEPYKMI